jgi:hypothetical protein
MGQFHGLVARGGFVVGAQWSGGMLDNATIYSKLGNSIRVSIGTGQTISIQGQNVSNTTLIWDTKVGQLYNIIGGAVYN